MSPLRVAVLGTGHLGRIHARIAAALEEIELVAVVDRVEPARQAVAQETHARAVADYREVVGEIEAAIVATPTTTHHAIGMELLGCGVPLLIEKPLAPTAAEADDLVTLARKNGLLLQVGHVERYNPALAAVAAEVRDPKYIEATRASGYTFRSTDIGVVLDLMIHDLDVILSLVNARPTRVSAVGIAVLTEQVDIANARIEFDNGAIANVTASRVSTSAQRKFRVFQHSQYLSIDFGNGQVRRVTREGERQADGSPSLTMEEWNLEKGDALLEETKAFVEAILEDKPCQVTGADGMLALELAETIIEEIARQVIM
jgi:predicted dehydrogenase